MNARDFFNLVKKMREAQKYYFNTKAPGSLSYSQRLEHEVDTEIKRVELVLKEQAQPRLFNNLEDFNNQ